MYIRLHCIEQESTVIKFLAVASPPCPLVVLNAEETTVIPLLTGQPRRKDKWPLKVIPLFYITHPYCARFFCVIFASHPEHNKFLLRLSSPEKRMAIYS